MKLEERIVLFSTLGEDIKKNINSEELEDLAQYAKAKNLWFTLDNVKNSLINIAESFLNKQNLETFVSQYSSQYFNPENPKNIGIVAAGNIPLVGLQDLIHVVLAGHKAFIKLSSQDEILMMYLIRKMHEINPESKEFIQIADKLNDLDAYIATGSGNTSRYFEYYFGKKPNIIRKNRISVAILTGNETRQDLANLGTDILSYFGLGCRSVSKIYVPENYDFVPFFESIEYWNTITLHSKYVNNYDYNKSIMLVNRDKHLDNGFLLLKETTEMHSPISSVFYENYSNIEDVKQHLENISDSIQCIISKETIDFGNSQSPGLSDFADNVDTIKFLGQI